MPEDILPDYYEILQVHPKASPEVIEAAWRRLSSMYHPDRYKEADGEERMKKINNAHDILKNPQERTKYDAARKLQEEMQQQGSMSEEEIQNILDEIQRQKKEAEEYIEKLARQRRRENEEELNRRVEEERKRLKREAEQLAEEVIEKARQSGQTGQGSSSGGFPPPPEPPKGTSQKRTEDITWKAPPVRPPEPAGPSWHISRRAVIIGLLGLVGVTAGGITWYSISTSPKQNKKTLYEENTSDGWRGWIMQTGKISLEAEEFDLQVGIAPIKVPNTDYAVEMSIQIRPDQFYSDFDLVFRGTLGSGDAHNKFWNGNYLWVKNGITDDVNSTGIYDSSYNANVIDASGDNLAYKKIDDNTISGDLYNTYRVEVTTDKTRVFINGNYLMEGQLGKKSEGNQLGFMHNSMCGISKFGVYAI